MFSEPSHLVTDPSDWEETQVPEVSEFDAIIRCHICKDLMKAPVMTSCYHCFCSVCIRRSLSTEERCPLCGTKQYESSLKKILVLDEVILWYSKNRAPLIDRLHTRDSRPRAKVGTSNDLIQPTVKSRSRRGSRQSNRSTHDTEDKEHGDDDEEGNHNTEASESPTTGEMVIEIEDEIDSSDNESVNNKRDLDPDWDNVDDGKYPNKKVRGVKRAKGANSPDSDGDDTGRKTPIPSSPTLKENGKSNKSPSVKDEETPKFIECPVCQELMTKEEIESTHLSKCLLEHDSSSPKSGATTAATKSPFKSSKNSASKSSSPFFNLSSPVKATSISSSTTAKSRNISDLLSQTNSTTSLTSKNLKLRKPAVTMATSYFQRNPSSIAHSTFKAPRTNVVANTEHQSQSKEFANTPKLPVLDFPSYNTNKLKQKLQSLNLQTDGSRLQLENRYSEYRILFNANLDSIHPVSTKSLIHQLRQHEVTVNFNPHIESDEGKKKKETAENKKDRYSWNKEHGDDFKELVRRARGQLKSNPASKKSGKDPLINTVESDVDNSSNSGSSEVPFAAEPLFVDDNTSFSQQSNGKHHTVTNVVEINGVIMEERVKSSEPLFLPNNDDAEDSDDYSLLFGNKGYNNLFINAMDSDKSPEDNKGSSMHAIKSSKVPIERISDGEDVASKSPTPVEVHKNEKIQDPDNMSIDSISDFSDIEEGEDKGVTDSRFKISSAGNKNKVLSRSDTTSGGVSRNLRNSPRRRATSAPEEVIEIEEIE